MYEYSSHENYDNINGIKMAGSWWETVLFWSSAKFMDAFYYLFVVAFPFPFRGVIFRNEIVCL